MSSALGIGPLGWEGERWNAGFSFVNTNTAVLQCCHSLQTEECSQDESLWTTGHTRCGLNRPASIVTSFNRQKPPLGTVTKSRGVKYLAFWSNLVDRRKYWKCSQDAISYFNDFYSFV